MNQVLVTKQMFCSKLPEDTILSCSVYVMFCFVFAFLFFQGEGLLHSVFTKNCKQLFYEKHWYIGNVCEGVAKSEFCFLSFRFIYFPSFYLMF